MQKDYTSFVRSSILRTKEHDPVYYKKCLEQRLCSGKGSITEYTTVEDLEYALMHHSWYSYEHPAIADGCRAFVCTSIRGWLGMAPLSKLDLDYMCTLLDVKGTGKLSLVLTDARNQFKRWPVDYTVLIVGDDGYGASMFTFHPGDPLPPSRLSSDGKNELGLKDGDKITVRKAIELGFAHAKLIG